MIESYHNFLKSHNMLEKTKHRSIGCDGKDELIARLIVDRKPKSILEIGRCNGYSFGMFKFFAPDAYVVSIDIKPTKEAQQVADLFDNMYCFLDGESDILCFNFHIQAFDLVLIDGDHSYEGARKDWINVRHKLYSNSVVLFDDVGKKNGEYPCGCGKFFDELQSDIIAEKIYIHPYLGKVIIK